ncbi:MAG: iron transporter [Nitriliruptorales bacterium]|nr:iron transporter [Nitriliruptorales bacterium]
MIPSLLIMVREGFEAALVVALVLAYLRRIKRDDMTRSALLGVTAAILLSVAVGAALHLTVGSLEGMARMVAFATVSVCAAGVLTWMVFWMRAQSRAIKGELEQRVGRALEGQRAGHAVAAVAFFAVLREGVETALFLVAASTGTNPRSVVAGAAIGLAIAVLLGFGVYAAGRRMPMRAFFQVTGLIVIVFAAGLLARSVMLLQSAGLVGTVNEAVYDLTGVPWLTQSTQVGKFLGAMLGWDPRPSVEQVVVWLLYIVPVTWAFLRPPIASALRRAPVSSREISVVLGVPATEPHAAHPHPSAVDGLGRQEGLQH